MNLRELGILFLRQSAAALSLFVCCCISMETIFPGFAAPFVHIPILGLSAILLTWAIPSNLSEEKKNKAGTIFTLVLNCIIGLFALAYLLTLLSPLGTIAWIRFAALSAALVICLFLLWKNPASYE